MFVFESLIVLPRSIEILPKMSLTSFGTGYPQTVHTAVKYQATIF
jgi:hypothetical protein